MAQGRSGLQIDSCCERESAETCTCTDGPEIRKEDGAYGRFLDAASLAAFPLRYYVDRTALLLQPHSSPIFCRDRGPRSRRRASEVASARDVVVSMGRDGHRHRR